MSLRSLLNRTVNVRPRATGARNAHGNQALGFDADSPPIPARRDQTTATEDTADRDQQARVFRYTLPLRVWDAGASYTVAISGRDRLVDGDEVFEVIGSPELVYRRRHPHHWEAVARLVEG